MTNKLSKTVKEKWLKALRSGKYVQAKGTLYDGEDEKGRPKMCCLGVLENILGTDKTYMENEEMPVSLSSPKSPKMLLIESKPANSFDELTIPLKLSYMNDGGQINGKIIKKRGFRSIANWIEKNL